MTAIRTSTAADRLALREDLERVRSMLSLIESDQNPSYGRPSAEDMARDFIYLKSSLLILNAVLSGTDRRAETLAAALRVSATEVQAIGDLA